MSMFHVTPKKNLKKILTQGLLPRQGARSMECNEPEAAIFFFVSRDACDTAMENWLGGCFEDLPENSLAILEVAMVDGARTKSDVEYELAVLTHIAPEKIVAIYHEDWTLDTKDYKAEVRLISVKTRSCAL